MNELM